MSLGIGILGASRIAELAIVGPAHDLGHRLVAVAARDKNRAQLFAEKHGVEHVLASYDEVIADPGVDVIYNPLANALHAPWNLAAVAVGKPVLTEKPFARNRAEAQRVAVAGRRSRHHRDGRLSLSVSPGHPPGAGDGERRHAR
jgi:predicted dehydrogenase